MLNQILPSSMWFPSDADWQMTHEHIAKYEHVREMLLLASEYDGNVVLFSLIQDLTRFSLSVAYSESYVFFFPVINF